MLERGNGPLRGRVALRAILPEKFLVPVLVRVTARTVQDHLFGSDERMACLRPSPRAVLLDPTEELAAHLPSLAIGSVFFQLAQSELR